MATKQNYQEKTYGPYDMEINALSLMQISLID